MELIDTEDMLRKKRGEEKKLQRTVGVRSPKVHFTVIGSPDEIAYLKNFIKKRGYASRSRFVVENLIALFKEAEEKEKFLNEKKENC